jgi:hypothetical protein
MLPRLACLLLCLAPFAFSQDYRAKVQGTVTDSSQAVVAGAKVTLINTATGVSATKTTELNGRYFFDFVEPGPYTVTAELAGFATVIQQNIQVQVRGDVTVDLTLKPSAVSEQITVTEAPVSVQFNTSTVETTIDRKMLTELPILSRNPFSLALLDTSVANRYNNDRNPFYMYSSSMLDIGGPTTTSGGGQNDLLLDGAPIQLGNKGSYAPPMDAVQEFSVQQSSVDAEFGHSAGGIMSVSMKAGTNEYHGTAYYFGRNPKLNAVSNAIARTPNTVRNHIYGFSLGGPARRNKLFNFATFERWNTRDPRNHISTMPTDLERIGDFSQSLNILGGQRTIFDPQTTVLNVAANRAPRQPFPGNKIPASLIDPVARVYMTKYIWKPNNPGNDITGIQNFRTTYSWMNRYWNFSDRADWNINDKWKMFGRYSRFRTLLDMSKFVDSIAVNNNIGGQMNSRNIAFDSVYTLSPSTVLNVRWSYGSLQDDYDPTWTEVTKEQLLEVWGGRLWDEPYTKNVPKRMLPLMNISGKGTFGRSSMWFQQPHQYSWHARLSQGRGSHYLKYGGEARYHRSNVIFPNPNSFTFTQNYTADSAIGPDTRRYGDSYATFLLGAIDNSSWARYTEQQNVNVHYYAAYVQDDWKATRRLTLNMGLRWEYETPPWDTHDRLSRYLDLTNPIPEMQRKPPVFPAEVLAYRSAPQQFNGAWMFATPEERGLYNTSAKIFSPRIGFAFRVDRRSALRASWSRFITPVVTLTDTQRPMELYGFSVTTTALPAVEGRPQAKLRDPFPAGVNPLIMPKGKALGRYQNLGDSAAWSNQNFDRPRSDRLSISYQRELWQRISVDATFYYNWINSLYESNVNQADPNLSLTYKAALSRNVPNPFYLYGDENTFPGQLRNRATVSIASLLRPHPHYLDLTQRNTEGMRNRFRSWQFKARRQFSAGYMFLFSYNYNRERWLEFWDNVAEYARQFEWRESPEARHRLSLSGTVELPFGKKRRFLSQMPRVLDGVLGGWSVSNIFTWNQGSLLTFGEMKLLKDINPKLDNPTRDRYFDTSIFDRAEPFTRRTNPKQYEGLRGPGRWNIDTTLSKSFPLTERFKLEFRMEAYNLTNSIMWGNPVTSVTNSLFGRITSQVNRGRELQYCARLQF